MKKMLSLMLVGILALTACQTTLENPTIRLKDDNAMIEKARGADSSSDDTANTGILADLAKRLNIPDRYVTEQNYSDERMTLTADAKILIPEYAMPVAKVEPIDFSQELVTRIYDRLIGDTPMFQEQFPKPTKKDLQEGIENYEGYIPELREQIAACANGCTDECKDNYYVWNCTDRKKDLAYAEKTFAKMKQAVKTATDTVTQTPLRADSRIKTIQEYDWFQSEVTGEYIGFRLSDSYEGNYNDGVSFSLSNNGGWSRDYFNELALDDDEESISRFDNGANLTYRNPNIGNYNSGVSYIRGGIGYGMGTFAGEQFTHELDRVSIKDQNDEENAAYFKAWEEYNATQPTCDFIETVNAADYSDDYSERAGAAAIFGYGDAISMVEDFLDDIGVHDMKPNELSSYYIMNPGLVNRDIGIDPVTGGKAWNGDVIDAHMEAVRNGEFDDDILDVQILVSLSREHNGVPVTASEQSGYYGQTFDYSLRGNYNLHRNWHYETFHILVSKDGIIGFDWNSPHKVVETIVRDSEMIMFDDVADIFETMFRVKYSGHMSMLLDTRGAVTTREIGEMSLSHESEITSVTLSLRRVLEQGNPDYGLLVPVWDFYGIIKTTTYEDGVAFPHKNSTAANEPLLTINAIDGTIVDINKGY